MTKSRRNTRKAAVVVLLDTSNNTLILTKRTKHLAQHAGEICFPGGQYQSDDSSLQSTAMRELEEELGIHASRLTAIRPLKQVLTLTDFCISPWFAKISSIHPFKLQACEVEQVVLVNLSEACVHTNYQTIQINRAGHTLTTEQFVCHEYTIWGATAKIMHQLCDISIDAGDMGC